MSIAISIIKWFAVMAVAYVIGYFCRRAVMKKQIFSIAYRPTKIAMFALVFIIGVETYFLYHKTVTTVEAVLNARSLMHNFVFIPLFIYFGFAMKSDECIAAEDAAGEGVLPAVKTKLYCILIGLVVLFALAFWVCVSAVGKWI